MIHDNDSSASGYVVDAFEGISQTFTDPQQEQFGDDRLLEVLRRTNFENAQQVIESMKQEVEAYRNGAEPNDDFTMMCVKVR